MSQANKDLLQRWFDDVWNAGRAAAIDQLLTHDAVVHGLLDLSGQPVSTRDRFHEYHAQFRSAFPDISVTLDEMVAEADLVAGRLSVNAKHSGPGLGIDATNADVAITGMVFIRVADGMIAEAWNSFDFLKMSQQLGLL